MANKRHFISVFLCLSVSITSLAQNDFESFEKRMNNQFDAFQQRANNEYNSFLRRVNAEYAAMLERAWAEYRVVAKIEVPEDKLKPIPPVVFPKKDENKKLIPKELPYKDVVPVPVPKPQPQPVAPIEQTPTPVNVPKVEFSFFGTKASVRFDSSHRLRLDGVSERSIAQAWKQMSTDAYSNLVYDCLQIRQEKKLCDWGYLEMLKYMADCICGTNTNEATLLMAYVYCQSGYKMRLARTDMGKLIMLYASDHIIYNLSYFVVDGKRYYPYGVSSSRIYICDITFPNEQAMSLLIPVEQQFDRVVSQPKTRQSRRYPEMRTTMTSNTNLMNFYSTYPTSMIGENMVSRWAMYANTPLSEEVKAQIYPSLRAGIQGCNQLTAVNKLLNYVQTGFVYEYDDKVWGRDRAFFAEESLYYPYCDCEDRSILFTRLVRDLLGLNCILIYYPGHLASAVEFTEQGATGDYFQLNGRKFIVADATYVDAPVGHTMPNMNNRTAKVIILK